MTDIFLAHGYFLTEDVKEQEIMRPYPPLGLLYISGHLKRAGFSTYLFDSTFREIDGLKQELLERKPKILALYTNLMTKLNVLKIIEFMRSEIPECHIVVGGPDVTYNIENYLDNGVDYLVLGEGEITCEELCSHLLQSATPPTLVSGLAFKQEGKLVKTAARIKVKELDSLADPDRASIDFEQYLDVWKRHHGKRTANISTQRGCPYTCKWCSTAVYGQSYRRRPAHLVADEIEMLSREYGVEALWFVDDVFTVSHKWLAQLHKEFEKRSLKIDFECITRAERLNDTVLEQLKEMGCFRIWIGAESGSQKIIDKMDRRVDINLVSEMIQTTQEKGMEAGTFIMVGYPDETLDDIKATARYLKEAKPNVLTITKTYPIKGTSLYNEIEHEITVKPAWNTSTDRDIEFALRYSKKFYHYAIRYIMSEYHQANEQSALSKAKFFLKSKLAYALMKMV